MAGIFLFICVRKKGSLHLALALFQFIPVFRSFFLFYTQTRSMSFKVPASNQKHVGAVILCGACGLTFTFFYFLDAPSSMWDLSSQTGDQTFTHHIGSMESCDYGLDLILKDIGLGDSINRMLRKGCTIKKPTRVFFFFLQIRNPIH